MGRDERTNSPRLGSASCPRVATACPLERWERDLTCSLFLLPCLAPTDVKTPYPHYRGEASYFGGEDRNGELALRARRSGGQRRSVVAIVVVARIVIPINGELCVKSRLHQELMAIEYQPAVAAPKVVCVNCHDFDR